MDCVRDFVGKIDETGRGDETHFFIGLASNSGKLDQLTALSRYVGKTRNLGTRRVRIRCGGQFRGEQQLRHAHGLVDENLFAIFVALPPFQDVFKSHHGGLEFEGRLEKKREQQYVARIVLRSPAFPRLRASQQPRYNKRTSRPDFRSR